MRQIKIRGKILIFFLCFCMSLFFLPVVAFAEESELQEAYRTTGDYLEKLGEPGVGSVGGEWMVLGLLRSDRTVSNAYYQSAVSYVREHSNEKGQLHSAKATENARIILALTAMGKDVTNVGGCNLLLGLNDLDYIQKQGINGPIWALIALDSNHYPIPDGTVTRETLLNLILDAQTPDGGWTLSGEEADADMTGMALTALAPYYASDENVKEAVEKALDMLSAMQNEDGSFSTFAGSNGKIPASESTAQVLVALSALGIDGDTDTRFIKNGKSAVDGLLGFYVEGGGFQHMQDGTRNSVATEQGYYALTAYHRLSTGKTSLYDMSDVEIQAEPSVESKEEAVPATLLFALLILVLGGILVGILLKKKKTANLVMVLVIVGLALGGGILAFHLKGTDDAGLGSQYQIHQIQDHTLLEAGQTDTCTIVIVCDTILDHLDQLEKEKIPYVPENGVILPETTVSFAQGDTVFDVLQKVCAAAEIQLEFSWTPLYDSSYIEGINHLYEFDCGVESGWVYQVNQWFPNYGCSSYELKDGDQIVWYYTCVGLGADVGKGWADVS